MGSSPYGGFPDLPRDEEAVGFCVLFLRISRGWRRGRQSGLMFLGEGRAEAARPIPPCLHDGGGEFVDAASGVRRGNIFFERHLSRLRIVEEGGFLYRPRR